MARSERSSYVPGQVPGKKKVTVYLDEAVARGLRIMAAEDGRAQSEIVEGLIRQALAGKGRL